MAAVAAKQTLWLGNKWQISVVLSNKDGTPFSFSNNRKPAGNLYLGPKANGVRPLTIENSGCLVLDQTTNPGALVFQVHASSIDPVALNLFKSAFNRLEVLLLDVNGEATTQQVILLDIRDPHIDDVTGATFAATVITVQGSLTLEGGASVPGSGGAILKYPVTSVSTYNAVHSFDYQPNVWAVDSDNEPVEVDFAYATSTQVHFTFGTPFTGTLYLS